MLNPSRCLFQLPNLEADDCETGLKTFEKKALYNHAFI